MSSTRHNFWLVVEDASDDFILLRRALQRVAPEVALRWAKDGFEAKSYLLHQRGFRNERPITLPTAIVSDLKMPRCNGLELLEWTKQQPEFGHLPFILLSSSGEDSDVTSAYAKGADGYLTKPTAPSDLVHMLSVLVERFRAIRPSLTP